ncbi:MAG: hypothetical protein H7Z11_15760 [Verrucomicrobia bacterium]|nr:hypothetical protein [Leptolyngbya sp. ES-bin-22]
MSWKKLFVQDSGGDEKGSFSDRESKHTYDNVGDLTKADRVNDAKANGDDVVLIDDPYDGSQRSGGIDSGQRHNLFYAENDDQGTPSPRKHNPGR